MTVGDAASMTEHGDRKSGTAVADDDVEAMADEAEAGYDLEAVRRRAGRLAMGFASASVESVRLDPQLKRPAGNMPPAPVLSHHVAFPLVPTMFKPEDATRREVCGTRRHGFVGWAVGSPSCPGPPPRSGDSLALLSETDKLVSVSWRVRAINFASWIRPILHTRGGPPRRPAHTGGRSTRRCSVPEHGSIGGCRPSRSGPGGRP